MGKKKNEDPKRDIYIKIKVTEDERQKIKKLSSDNMISVSDMIRLGLNTVGGLDLEYGNKKRKA